MLKGSDTIIVPIGYWNKGEKATWENYVANHYPEFSSYTYLGESDNLEYKTFYYRG